jgi:hypothetical protein
MPEPSHISALLTFVVFGFAVLALCEPDAILPKKPLFARVRAARPGKQPRR